MPLSESEQAELKRLSPRIVEAKLQKAGASPYAVVPGLGNGLMLRGDVEDWLAQQYRRSSRLKKLGALFTFAVTVATILGMIFEDRFGIIHSIGNVIWSWWEAWTATR
jgi:hypothetical protein